MGLCLSAGIGNAFGVSWNANTAPRLAAPRLSRMLPSLLSTNMARSHKWCLEIIIKHVRSPQRVRVDTCLSWIWILDRLQLAHLHNPLQGLFSAGTSCSEVLTLVCILSALVCLCISLLSASLLYLFPPLCSLLQALLNWVTQMSKMLDFSQCQTSFLIPTFSPEL